MKRILAILLCAFGLSPVAAQQRLGHRQLQNALQAAIQKLSMAEFAIDRYYVDTVDADKLTEAAINGMLGALDPHSSYSNAKQTKSLNEPLNGNFEGVGIQFSVIEDTVVVIQPVPKGPSQRVGIEAGDRIVRVNDTLIAGVKISNEEIQRRLRGPKGTKVKVTVRRVGVGQLLDFEVTRDKIPLHTLDAAYMLTPHIGYVRFSSFGAKTDEELREALEKLKKKGMHSLVLDLRENGGGYLQAAFDVSNEFLQQGDMVVYTKGRNVMPSEYRAKGGGLFTSGKLAVLVDEYTASAAEILSGAVQDHDRGIIVGRRTFGKGLVQQPVPLPDGSMIRLTVARYYTPSGRCIQKPYKKGESEAYRLDLINRYRNGELSNPDSIHLADSLKYSTLKRHRTVYGGGGIMPDYFIPLDTTATTKYYRELMRKGAILSLANKFIDAHRRQLVADYPTPAAFMKGYDAPQEFCDSVAAAGKKLNVAEPATADERQRTFGLLKKVVKALAARDLWTMSEYFEIMNEGDSTIARAVELLK